MCEEVGEYKVLPVLTDSMLVVVTELNITVITVVSARVAARLLQAGRWC